MVVELGRAEVFERRRMNHGRDNSTAFSQMIFQLTGCSVTFDTRGVAEEEAFEVRKKGSRNRSVPLRPRG